MAHANKLVYIHAFRELVFVLILQVQMRSTDVNANRFLWSARLVTIPGMPMASEFVPPLRGY
jgi:hypothetical protein